MAVLKVKSRFIIKVLFCLATGLGVHASANASSDNESILIMPFQASLTILEDRLNAEVQDTLVNINEPNKVCVKANWVKTKVPYVTWEMKNILGVKTKIPTTRTKIVKTKTSPEIRCDIKGWVKRNGHISVSGSGSTIKFSFPVIAQVTAKAGIRKTAKAAAVIYLSATPRINSDWSISVDAAPDFSWSQRPTMKLFGLINVTIGSKVEPRLRGKMNEFVKKIPGILAKLRLREKVAAAWSEVQNPIMVSEAPEVWVFFNPKSVAYSGFIVEDNILKTALSLKGHTQVTLGKPIYPSQKTGLSNLGAIPYQDGEFSLSLPVFLSYSEVIALANEKFADGYVTELESGPVKGTIRISNPGIQKGNDGKLLLSVSINYDNRSRWLKAIDIFDWFDIDGVLTFGGTPSINTSTRTLRVDELDYDSSSSSKLFNALVEAAGITVVRNHLERQIVFAYGATLDNGIAKVNSALNITTLEGVKVSASLQNAAIDKLSVNDRNLRIDAKLSGVVSASVGL